MFRRLFKSKSSGTDAATAEPLDPEAFAKLYVAYLRKQKPDLTFEKTGELELRVRFGDDVPSHSVFLDNAYNQYLNDPDNRDEILELYIGSFLEVLDEEKNDIDPARIVPVIKDRAWLEEIQKSMEERGAGPDDLPEYVSDPYNSELTIFFAEDSERNIRYLTEEGFAELDLDRETLLEHALGNLKQLIGDIQVMGDDGIYMITAGGDYEASLLLLDSLWDKERIEVDGEFIVAIPSRDLLIVTGSDHEEAIARLREMANESAQQFSYSLTPVLFVRKEGKFEVFEG